MTDPMASAAAQTAFKHGQEYLEQNVGCADARNA